MVIFSKKALMGLCLLLSMGYHTYAVEVGIGARVGANLPFNKLICIGPTGHVPFPTEKSYSPALSLGVFTDIWLLDWLALTPAFTASLFNRSKLEPFENTVFTAHNHTFDLDLLAKFKVHWWYGAIGAGLTLATKPNFSTKESDKSFNLPVNNHIGMNIIIETGLYIPLGKEAHHNLLVGLRGTLNLFSFNILRRESDLVKIPSDAKESLRHLSRAIVGLFLGYVYKF